MTGGDGKQQRIVSVTSIYRPVRSQHPSPLRKLKVLQGDESSQCPEAGVSRLYQPPTFTLAKSKIAKTPLSNFGEINSGCNPVTFIFINASYILSNSYC